MLIGGIHIKNKILSILEENKGEFVSGEYLGDILNISRTAIWKNINLLKKEGYKIQSRTNKGYLLSSDTDIITEEKVSMQLNTKVLGNKILIYNTIDSTNNQLRQEAYNDAKEGMVIISDEQLKGKGRNNKLFYSPKRNGIYMSILLRPKILIENINLITILSAISVVEAIEKIFNIKIGIKWVNDILYNNKKLCGILTEASIQGESGEVEFIVVGIGINFGSTKEFPKEFNKISIALQEILGTNVSRSVLVSEIINIFEKNYLNYINGISTNEIINRYREKLCILGKEVNVIQGDSSYRAQVLDVSDKGRLIVKKDSDKIEELNSGEVSLCI